MLERRNGCLNSFRGTTSLVIASALGLLIGVSSIVFFPLVVFLPMVAIYFGVKDEWYYSLVPLILCAGIVYSQLGIAEAGIVLIFSTPLIASGIFVLKKKWRPFESVAVCIGACLVGILACYFFANQYLGMDVITYGVNSFSQYLQSLPEDMYNSVIDSLSQTLGTDVAQNTDPQVLVQSFMRQAEEIIRGALPTMIIVYSALGGLITYAVTRRKLENASVRVVGMPRFYDYILPNKFARFSILMLILSFFMMVLGDKTILPIAVIFSTVFMLLFMVQGLAVIDFYLARSRVPLLIRWMVMAFLYAILGTMLYLVGMFDQMFRFRARSARQS